jgi:hypothetical protein
MPRPWNPTHFLTFTPSSGAPETWVVMLATTPDAGGMRRAWTKDEWLKSSPGTWVCTIEGMWLCEGFTTPGKRPGKVSVKETSGGFHKVQWLPTHRITFYPKGGGEARWWTVMARPDPYRPGTWAALTRDEWFAQCPPEWTCDQRGRWTWRGMATPKDEPGAVTIEDISGAYPIQQPEGGEDQRRAPPM